MRQHAASRHPTLEDLERWLELAAYVVMRHGDVYLPIFERFERELSAARAKTDARSRASSVLQRLRPVATVQSEIPCRSPAITNRLGSAARSFSPRI